MVGRICFLILLVVGSSAVLADGLHQDIDGHVDDEHGNVEWKSSVKQGKQLWEYYYSAKNRDDKLNCRVNWVLPKQKWLIPPLETSSSRTNLAGKPIDKEGEFRYNGGAAAGEGVSKTLCWVDHNPKADERSTTTDATVFINLDGSIFAVDVHASSEFSKGMASYKIVLKPAERTVGRYERDLDKLFAKCRLQWVSIQSPAWTRIDAVTEKAGRFADGAIITLDKSTLTFEAYLSMIDVKDAADVTVSKEVLRFFVGDESDRVVLCEVAVPAIVPNGK